ATLQPSLFRYVAAGSGDSGVGHRANRAGRKDNQASQGRIVSACIGKVVTVISALGSDHLVITQKTTALSESRSVEVERVRTVMTSEKADGGVISERTATSVISKEAEHTIAAERSERIRKLGLVDRPVINRPALAKRLRLGGRVILSKDEGALLAD